MLLTRAAKDYTKYNHTIMFSDISIHALLRAITDAFRRLLQPRFSMSVAARSAEDYNIPARPCVYSYVRVPASADPEPAAGTVQSEESLNGHNLTHTPDRPLPRRGVPPSLPASRAPFLMLDARSGWRERGC